MLFLALQLGDVLLQLGADGQHLTALGLCQLRDLLEIRVVRLIGKPVLIHVGGIDNRLQCQKIRGCDEGLILIGALECPGGLTAVQMSSKRLEYVHLMQKLLIALGGLGSLVHTALHHVQIGHDKFHVNRLNIPYGVNGDVCSGIGYHVHDVFIIKAADHMDNGIRLPDIGQELIAKTSALTGALHQTRNVHELNDRRGLLIRLVDLRQLVQPRIRHSYHAHIGINGAERVIGALRTGVGNGVEQGRFAHIGQSHDT